MEQKHTLLMSPDDSKIILNNLGLVEVLKSEKGLNPPLPSGAFYWTTKTRGPSFQPTACRYLTWSILTAF